MPSDSDLFVMLAIKLRALHVCGNHSTMEVHSQLLISFYICVSWLCVLVYICVHMCIRRHTCLLLLVKTKR